MIHWFSEDIKFNLKNKRLISKWLNQISASFGKSVGEINYIFCSDNYLLDINKKFLGHDYFTDIITFDNSDSFTRNDTVYADIFISIDTVKINAGEYGEGFERELHRVIAHGLLHLIGFDDTDEQLQKEMTCQENAALDLYDRLIS